MIWANWPSPIEAEVAVARYAEIDQVAVGEIGAGEDRGHATVHRVEAVRRIKEIVRRLRRAADAGNLRHAMRLDRELEAGFNDRGGDRVVAAARAERRDFAFVVAAGVAEAVLWQFGMMEFRLHDVGHVVKYTRCCREFPALECGLAGRCTTSPSDDGNALGPAMPSTPTIVSDTLRHATMGPAPSVFQ